MLLLNGTRTRYWKKARHGRLRVFVGNMIYWVMEPLKIGRVRGIVNVQGKAFVVAYELAPTGPDTFTTFSTNEVLVDFAVVMGALEYIEHDSTTQVLLPL